MGHNLNSYLVWSEDKNTKSTVRQAWVSATSRNQARRDFIKYNRPHMDTDNNYHRDVKICVQSPEW